MTGAVKSANIGERMEKLRLPEARKGDGEKGGDAGGGDDQDTKIARLEKLGDLKEKGVLSDEEFAAEKAKVMRDSSS